MDSYDLVVIGSGPAGEKGAVQAAYLGRSVLVVDSGLAGGAWVNTGTIPSKTLRETALYLAGGRRLGLETPFGRERSVANLMAMERRIVNRWREKVERSFRLHGVERRTARARFVDAHTLELSDGTKARGEHILVATGSRPRPVEFAVVDGVRIHDSDTLLRIPRIPETLVVLGGGVIACEYASIMQALGVQVTLLNGRERLLRWLDAEASALLEEIFVQAGMVVRHGASARSTQVQETGVEVLLDDGTLVQGDMCLVGLGRLPNTEGLGLEKAGLELDDWGTISVDGYQRTSAEHIYAAGDVVGFPSLASVSMEQGRVATAHMFGEGRGELGNLFPYGVYTIPELSTVGKDETSARAEGLDVVSGCADYRHSARSVMLGAETGMVKIVVERGSRKLLGATIVGAQATELIHYAAAVVHYGGTIDELITFVFNLPTLSVLYKQAAYDAIHKLRLEDGSQGPRPEHAAVVG
ncbi:MAG: NAD(P)(+) transhydrogenase [Rickettsiales bacterium]|nr:NAD(P)(+) transhydrogenase [Rickettsiales bacterium]